jgi:UDP:flavonoid glycosyltransferase YjiC (YdhE family)
MVIHHGGAGTSHTATHAGVPSIVIPFAGDQFFWAGRLAAAGVAPKYASHTKINAQKLSPMIAFAENPEVVLRAKALGEAMTQEEGVLCAVKHIEKLMAQAS